MDSKHRGLSALYYMLALLTIVLCLYVIISYIRNKSYRKPPAGLMLSKTASDLVFTITIFVMLLFVDMDEHTVDNKATPACKIFGPLFILSFITAQLYFTSICWDLYRTLSNPFRKPSADSIKLQLFVWLFAGILVAIVSPFNVFRYRTQYSICFSCDTGPKNFSIYNAILFYIPMILSNSSGIVVTIYAFKRLSNGLEKTFELRQQIIKRQLILVGFLATLSLITVISWCIIIYAKSFQQKHSCTNISTHMCLDPNKKCHSSTLPSNKPRILLSILVLLNGAVDAAAWYLLQKLTKSKTEKISKTIHVEMNRDENNRSSLISEHHDTTDDIIDVDDVLNSSNNSGNSSGHSSRTNKDDDYGSNNKKETQNVSNALRGEIISYMTAGLARSIYNTANETYKNLNFSGDDHAVVMYQDLDWTKENDGDVDGNEYEFHDDEKMDKQLGGAKSNSVTEKANILNCEEPKLKNAQYPLNVHHDPKTHQGVINEMYIQLPTQNFLSNAMRVPMVTSSNPSNCVVNNKNNISLQNFNQLKHNQSIVSSTNNKQPLKQIEDDQSIDEIEQNLLSSLDVKKQTSLLDDTKEEEEMNMDIYESNGSDVEMSITTKNKQFNNQTNIQLQQLNDEEPPFYKQTSTGSIIESFTRTMSQLVNNNNIINDTTDTFNTQYASGDGYYATTEFDGTDNNNNGDNYLKKIGIPFKDYAPHVFRYLRTEIYKINDIEYLESVRPPNLEEQTKLIQEKFSEGRSGAFFFFTHDSKYIIKTVSKQEATLLLKILPQFIKYYKENRSTLINRFFGLHSITMYNLQLYFVVLENIFVAGSKPHEIYDIKGSWIDRHTNHHVESGKLMKDQDLHKTLKLIPNISNQIYKQVKSDSKFLFEQNIMDYSVLLGIYYVGIDPNDVKNDRIMQNYHDNTSQNQINQYIPPNQYPDELKQNTIRKINPNDIINDNDSINRPIAPSYQTGLKKFGEKDKAVKARVIEGPGIYYLGIIDVLQEWDTQKKLEKMAKVYLRCKSKYGISCVEPNYYRKRFLRKMHRIGIRPIQNE